MSMLRRALSLEEVSDGKANLEIEHVFYARIPDMSILDKAASFEHQEQWQLKIPKTEANAAGGVMRIRKTVAGAELPEYVLTTKTAGNNDGERIEVPIPTTIDNFEQFKLFAEEGMIKDRYFFPVEGTDIVFEVDMFLKPDAVAGSKDYHDWCKIDIEVKNRDVTIPPLPFEVEGLITAPYGERNEAEEARVSSLYKNEFIALNQRV